MVLLVAFLAKAEGVHTRLAVFNTKAAAVAVRGNRSPLFIHDRRSGMSSVMVAHIASAVDTADEIATDSATPWAFSIGGHCYHLTPSQGFRCYFTPPQKPAQRSHAAVEVRRALLPGPFLGSDRAQS
jgi:hypothetical protein